jgi:hypothetical protein
MFSFSRITKQSKGNQTTKYYSELPSKLAIPSTASQKTINISISIPNTFFNWQIDLIKLKIFIGLSPRTTSNPSFVFPVVAKQCCSWTDPKLRLHLQSSTFFLSATPEKNCIEKCFFKRLGLKKSFSNPKQFFWLHTIYAILTLEAKCGRRFNVPSVHVCLRRTLLMIFFSLETFKRSQKSHTDDHLQLRD